MFIKNASVKLKRLRLNLITYIKEIKIIIYKNIK
jgi:hypothetical protein